MKKVIRITESDLIKLVQNVLSEQKTQTIKGKISNSVSEFSDAKNRTYEVIQVKGNPMKMGKKIKTKDQLTPSTEIEMKKGDNILMRSMSEKDMEKGKRKYFQGVELFINDKGKFELFVNRA